MTFPHLQGLVAAPHTPFLSDGSLNLELVERQAASLAANGVTGAFVCGTTGESMSMTQEERKQVAERWIQTAPKELSVVVHVGHNAPSEAVALAAHAQKIGAAAIGAFAPSFFKPSNVEALVSYCAMLAAAAPELPFYYYHIPSMTGVNIPCADFLTAAQDRIPNLAGVKFTYEDLMDYFACTQFQHGKYDLVFGRDEILLAALALGAKGAIGSTYNYGAPIFSEIIRAFERQDFVAARAAQTCANAMIQVMIRHGGLAAGKAIMGLIGIDCGPARSPLRRYTPQELDDLGHDLDAVGFFEFCSKV